MYCLECKNLINKRIVYFNFFKKNIHKICEKCFCNMLFVYNYYVLPLERYLLHVNELVKDYNNALSLMSFIKPYYMYYLKNNLNSIILYFDILDEQTYKLLIKTNISDIYMIVLKYKIEKRNGYED